MSTFRPIARFGPTGTKFVGPSVSGRFGSGPDFSGKMIGWFRGELVAEMVDQSKKVLR